MWRNFGGLAAVCLILQLFPVEPATVQENDISIPTAQEHSKITIKEIFPNVNADVMKYVPPMATSGNGLMGWLAFVMQGVSSSWMC